MDSIGKQIFIETKYPGVTLGVIGHSNGMILIDAPPSPEDGRSWRASLMGNVDARRAAKSAKH